MDVPTAQELAAYTIAQQHPVTADWIRPQERLRLLAAEHGLDVRMATDLDFAGARRDQFAPELPTEYLLNSWERIADDLDVMVSMRWEGGAPDRPFVDACALSRPLGPDEDVLLARAAVRRYGRLGPRYVRWWSREIAGHYPGTLQDKRFLAAPLRKLVDADVPAMLTLMTCDDLDHYDDARDAYAAIDHEHPAHREQATLEAKDDLEELHRAGTLFDVRFNGEWIGYLGAQRGHKLGLAGYKIAELVLARHRRGRGLGRHLTTLLARELLARGEPQDAVIIGTIHNDNLGARRAAELSGRQDIGGWVRLQLT